MTSRNDTAPGRPPGAGDTTHSHQQDTTHPGHIHRLDGQVATAFLFAALTTSTTAVVAVAGTLAGHDFPHPHQWTLWQAIARRAGHQVTTDGAHLPVPAETVLGDLQAAGQATPEVRTLLLDAIDGNRAGIPLPATALHDLADQLRHGRLRRACITAGTALVDAARDGGTAEITRALNHILTHMPKVATRAGLEVQS